MDTSSQRGRLLVLVAVALACAAIGALIATSAGAGEGTVPIVDPSQNTRDRFPDALDAQSANSVALEAALQKIPRHIALPDMKLTGEAVRAVVDDWDGKQPSEYGLLVLYQEGLKFTVQHGEVDLDAKLLESKGAVFADGSTTHYRIADLAGRRALVVEGGIQVLTTGEYPVPNMVIWNDAGFTYKVQADTDALPIDVLTRVAATVK